MSALLEEVDQEIETRRKANEVSNQVVVNTDDINNCVIHEWQLNIPARA